MIRLRRPEEPARLARSRTWRLARALLFGELDTEVGYGFPEVREALAEAQHHVCAYCGEATVRGRDYDIEHFRPRVIYWWLSWTWENLWVSCPSCQVKGGGFELMPGVRRLPAPTLSSSRAPFETWREGAMLLDPGRDDPREHVRVVRDARTGQWRWEPVEYSVRGKHTIERLNLNDPARREPRKNHLGRVSRDCEDVLAALRRGEFEAVAERWRSVCRHYLSPGVLYLGASWHFVRAFHEAHALAEHGLSMPSYPDEHPAVPDTWSITLDVSESMRPAWLVGRALWLVRYLESSRAPADVTREAIVEVCSLQAQTYASLSEVLSRTDSTVRGHVSALEESGRVRVDRSVRPHVITS